MIMQFHRVFPIALAIVVILALGATPVAAQTPRIAPSSSVLFVQAGPALSSDTLSLPTTHWKTGAIIGGVGLGLLSAYAYYGLCDMESSDCGGYMIGGFVVGGLVGGITGALIGGLFPKDSGAQ